MILDLREALQRLAEMPGLGHVRDDLADESLRAWTVHGHVVIYRPDTAPLSAVRGGSGYRDIGPLFS